MHTEVKSIVERSREKLEFPLIVEALSKLAVSREGRELCLNLLPFTRLAEAETAQKQTEDTLSILLRRGQAPLQGLHYIRPFVKRAQMPGSVLSIGELMRIGSFLEAVERMAAYVPDEPGDNAFYALCMALFPLPDLRKNLNRSIIGEDELADDASFELARIRRQSKRSQENIKRHLEKILRSRGDILQEQIITLRQDRYVVPVKVEYRSQVPGIVHDTSQSGQTIFIEPLAVVEENNKIRELKIEEEREIRRILAAFSAEVSTHAAELSSDINLLAEADFYWAKAVLAKKMKAVRPILNDRGLIRLRQARHPHIPEDQVVPIDIRVGEEFKTLLITGPNTGGKTVSLKTVGLLSLMSMSGLQIPAASNAEMSVFEQVLADIGDEQSIEQSLSTFSSHMKNIVAITERVNDRSLVLVDELGSGTDPSEGAALAVAILEDLKRAGAVTVATTHYKELKVYALQSEGVENAACEFDTETLKPTYKLLIGVPGTSNAFIISRKLGLREDIIERANEELSLEDVRFEDVLARVDRARVESEKLLEEAEKARAEASRLKREAESEHARIREKKQDILNTAREESRQNLRRQTREVEALIKDMRQQMEGGHDPVSADAEALRSMLRSELNEIESEIGRETLRELKKKPSKSKEKKSWEIGDLAYAPALGIEGRIETEPDNKGKVQLRSGQLQIMVELQGLTDPPSERSKRREGSRTERQSASDGQKRQSVRMSKKANFTSELNIIGQRTAEGVSELDRYLDDAVLAGADTVRIVHGKGTGALRKAVQDFLARDSRILAWRPAEFGEGDAGVTIAELKNS